MANWQAGAAFSNSFLNTIQGLTALQNARMQNARLEQQMQREQEYENVVSEETKRAKGLDLGQAIGQGLNFQDVQNAEGGTITAQQQREALQGALQNPNLTNEERTAALQGYAGTELAMPKEKGGLDLAGLKAYQTAGGETKYNQLGREALGSDVNRAVRQRMLETGNIYGQEQALRMGKLTREDEKEYKLEQLYSNVAKAEQLLDGKDVSAAMQHISPMVASTTGHSINYVTKPNGKQVIEVADKKGKVLESFPATMDEIRNRVSPLVGDYIVKERSKFDSDFALKARDVESKAGYYEANKKYIEKKTAEGTGIGGAGGIKGFQQKVNDYSTMLFKSGQTNPKTGKPFTEAEAKQHTMAVMLKDTGLVGTDTGGSAVKSLGEGLVQVGRQVFQQDPKSGKWVPAEGLPGSAPDEYVSVLGGKGVDKSRPGGAGSAIPVNVPGRPLYNETTDNLTRMAKRPKGVSTAEANDAQAELDARKGESRMSATR